MRRNRAVEKTIKTLRQQVKAEVGALNQQAAKLVAKGAYGPSQGVIQAAQQMLGFSRQVDALWNAWRGGKGTIADSGQSETERTPLWEYYRVIAKSLADLGGEAKVRDVIAKVGSLSEGQFKAGDVALTSNGTPVWARSVRRARAPMIKERFLESVAGGRWRLTKLGRDLAKRANEEQAKADAK